MPLVHARGEAAADIVAFNTEKFQGGERTDRGRDGALEVAVS